MDTVQVKLPVLLSWYSNEWNKFFKPYQIVLVKSELILQDAVKCLYSWFKIDITIRKQHIPTISSILPISWSEVFSRVGMSHVEKSPLNCHIFGKFLLIFLASFQSDRISSSLAITSLSQGLLLCYWTNQLIRFVFPAAFYESNVIYILSNQFFKGTQIQI